jgi:predicted nucleic acid-binding protein
VIVLDTTILVGGLLAKHPTHAVCRKRLDDAQAKPGSHRCTTHALSEAFRVLASIPLPTPLGPATAQTIIAASLQPRLTLIALTAGDYTRAMDLTVRSGLGAGAVFDALHLCAAARTGAQLLITANLKHFRALAAAGNLDVRIEPP